MPKGDYEFINPIKYARVQPQSSTLQPHPTRPAPPLPTFDEEPDEDDEEDCDEMYERVRDQQPTLKEPPIKPISLPARKPALPSRQPSVKPTISHMMPYRPPPLPPCVRYHFYNNCDSKLSNNNQNYSAHSLKSDSI